MEDPNDVNDDLQVDLSSGNIITQLLSKHTNASQPESQQVVAVLRALQEVLESQGMNPSPTAVFAAIMTPLSQPEVHKRSSVEEIGAMATILSSVLPHTPAPALLPQYETVIQVMKALLVALAASTSPLRAALKCSGCVLRVVTADQWDKTEAFFCEVLKMCSDHRPKVRKQASAAIDLALRALEGTTVADKAGRQVAAYGVQVLAATGVAAQARRGKKGAELKAAEELVEKAVKEALHLMTTYKHLLPLIGPKAGATMCDPLVQLHAQGQPVLSQHAVDTLTELGTHLDAKLEAAPLAKMLKNVIKVNYDKKDLPLVLAVQRLLSQGFVRLHSMDPDASGKQLAPAVHHLVPHLALQEGIVYGATECLKTLIRTCVDAKMVQQTVQHMALAQQDDETAPGKMAPLQSVVVAVEAALGYRYRAAWPSVLPVASTLVERLGALSGMLLGGVLTALGELASAREPSSWPAVQTTFGVILRVMGPEHVLAALPLNLEQAVSMEGAEDEGDGWFDVAGCNVWLLPLLKQHLLGARLAYFASDILPLAKRMAENSKKAAASRKPLQAQRCITAEYQLWSTLPAFVTWCQDTPQAFPTIARDLGAYLQHREDLRTVLCSALQRIVSQNKQMVEGGSTEAPVGYTTELAAASIASVANFAKNFMPILFNLFVTVPLEHRGVIHNTIAAFASIADPATLGGFFRTIIKKLIKVQTDPEGAPGALLEGGDSVAARRCTFMELALALEPGLDEASVEMMFKQTWEWALQPARWVALQPA
ncbi:hypothetical protein CYMTET_8532 [Cymbomonas tetramitiformis]|uniref:Ribosomal RNA-processing protein 12-like conserved domain-containing protein n=1 Tax=Cymbomonas tetramitiformis TaxID=36881 RepID=A0AAE0GUQ7_9CHLO|nr:hypothetical protein CYMTET_8532 [Cymbomonas tetramitiformis]